MINSIHAFLHTVGELRNILEKDVLYYLVSVVLLPVPLFIYLFIYLFIIIRIAVRLVKCFFEF